MHKLMSEMLLSSSAFGILRRIFSPFCLRRLHGVKIAHRKAENQIKMAKMIMMNELNKRANLLIEQLEVITFSLFLSFLSFSQPWIYMQRISNRRDVINPESKQTRPHNNLSKLLKPTSQELHLLRKNNQKTSPAATLCVPVMTRFSLQKISEDFQQRLEDQLQGAIEMCGQLDHVQKFITWATTHHCRGPVLFSRALVRRQDGQQTSTVSL